MISVNFQADWSDYRSLRLRRVCPTNLVECLLRGQTKSFDQNLINSSDRMEEMETIGTGGDFLKIFWQKLSGGNFSVKDNKPAPDKWLKSWFSEEV